MIILLRSKVYTSLSPSVALHWHLWHPFWAISHSANNRTTTISVTTVLQFLHFTLLEQISRQKRTLTISICTWGLNWPGSVALLPRISIRADSTIWWCQITTNLFPHFIPFISRHFARASAYTFPLTDCYTSSQKCRWTEIDMGCHTS